jgi:hypothetical protein
MVQSRFRLVPHPTTIITATTIIITGVTNHMFAVSSDGPKRKRKT